MPHTPRKLSDSDIVERAPDVAEETRATARLSEYTDAAPTAGLVFEAGIAPHMQDVLHPKDIDLAARRADRHTAFKATTPSKPLKIRGDTIADVTTVLQASQDTLSSTNHGFSFAPAGPMTIPKDANYFGANKVRVLDTFPEASATLGKFDSRMQQEGFEPSIAGLSGAKIRDQASGRITIFGYGTKSTDYPRKLQLFLEFNSTNTAMPWRIVGMCDVPRFPIHQALFSPEKLAGDIESYLHGIKLRWSQYKSGPSDV